MTIVYVPSQESHTEEITDIERVIEIAGTYNPYDQQQYKRFIFCNMTPQEKHIIDCYLKQELSHQSGVPWDKVLKGQPYMSYIYLDRIGHIKMR